MRISPRPAVAWIRIGIGTLAVRTVAFAYFDGITAGHSNPFDFFEYFTNQTSLPTGRFSSRPAY